MTKRYLIMLAQEHLAFRIPELASVASIFGKQIEEIWDKEFITMGKKNVEQNSGENDESCLSYFTEETTPFVVLKNVVESEVKVIMSRMVLAKTAYEIWGHGQTYEQLKISIQNYPSEYKDEFFHLDSTFCMRVKSSGRKMPISEQIVKMDQMEEVLPFQGKVDLNSPMNEFHILEDYGAHKGKKLSCQPCYVYLGRCISNGQRNLIEKYCVKRRKFIGNTSMDTCLSFIMANYARPKPGDFICDPFVGTGSLLIAAAHFGAHVTGGDISYNILHARGKSSRVGAGYRQRDETIRDSLLQYGLRDKYVDVLLHDAARHPWRLPGNKKMGLFDAIITDPPYGIRESCRKILKKNKLSEIDEHPQHFPERTAYHLDQVFTDLLQYASDMLIPGGRLVYWIPIYKPEYTEDLLPKHPNLRLIHNCEQPLKRETSRRLIVMEKLEQVLTNGDEPPPVSNTMYKGHNAFRNKYFKC